MAASHRWRGRSISQVSQPSRAPIPSWTAEEQGDRGEEGRRRTGAARSGPQAHQSGQPGAGDAGEQRAHRRGRPRAGRTRRGVQGHRWDGVSALYRGGTARGGQKRKRTPIEGRSGMRPLRSSMRSGTSAVGVVLEAGVDAGGVLAVGGVDDVEVDEPAAARPARQPVEAQVEARVVGQPGAGEVGHVAEVGLVDVATLGVDGRGRNALRRSRRRRPGAPPPGSGGSRRRPGTWPRAGTSR